ncbi:hypothetical protein AB0K45_09655 [Micrococcus luteus]|uniref:hypothetical protein n=1 Tax=Micrococcus luteus TaxID=1270 RepID=UPI00342BDB6A
MLSDNTIPAELLEVVGEHVLCNRCGEWTSGPYRRGSCARCNGVWIGELHVCCGDCDRYPCECMAADDGDMAWLTEDRPAVTIAAIEVAA